MDRMIYIGVAYWVAMIKGVAPRVVVYGWLLVREHKDMGGWRPTLRCHRGS